MFTPVRCHLDSGIGPGIPTECLVTHRCTSCMHPTKESLISMGLSNHYLRSLCQALLETVWEVAAASVSQKTWHFLSLWSLPRIQYLAGHIFVLCTKLDTCSLFSFCLCGWPFPGVPVCFSFFPCFWSHQRHSPGLVLSLLALHSPRCEN